MKVDVMILTAHINDSHRPHQKSSASTLQPGWLMIYLGHVFNCSSIQYMYRYNNKTTSVVSEGAETHEWWSLAQEPPPETACRGGFQAITSVFLLPQKSHECGFIFILCHQNYRKTTFNSVIPHAKFAMTSRWRFADVATTSRRPVQQYAWRHWDSAMTLTQQRKSIYHICCIYIALVIVHALGWTFPGREY
jgi:hypothetical protein